MSIFVGGFTFLFTGIHYGTSAGIASVILQVQALTTIGIAALVLRERPSNFQLI